MAIYRIHFEHGEPMPLGGDYSSIARIAASHHRDGKRLDVGSSMQEINLTPKHWRKHTHEHHLLVSPAGFAYYFMIPLDADVGWEEIGRGEIPTFIKGGKVVGIPMDESVVVLGGPSGDGQRIVIYEIIYYLPHRDVC